MEIETEDGKTVYDRPHRLSYSEREQTKGLIKELKEADIVQDCCSPYVSPMLMVRKASDETRMCVDFRGLNKITVKDRKKYFTTLDLARGYYRIPVSKDSRTKTSS